MSNTDVADKKWLLKSASRVTGPFSSNQVVERILGQEVTSVDEVSSSFSRWRYIKEIAEFNEALKRAPENALSETTTAMPREETITTKTDQDGELIKDAIPASGVAGEPVVYSTQPLDRTNKATLAIYLLVFLVVAVGVYLYRAQNTVKSADFDRLFSSGSKAFDAGDFAVATEHLEYARRANPNNLEALYYLALSHTAERHTVIARRLFSELNNLDTTSKYRLERLVGESAVALTANDTVLALEKLEIAFSDSPRNPAVLNNLAVAYQKKGEPEKALDILHKTHEYNVMAPEHYLLLALVALNASTDIPRVLVETLNDPVKYLRKNLRLGFDVSVAHLLWRYRKTGQKPQALELQRLLDEDPNLSSDFRKDPLWNTDPIAFVAIHKWCDELASLTEDLALRSTLTANCLYRDDRKADAARALEPHLSQAQVPALVLAYKGFLDRELGRLEDAMIAADFSRRQDPTLVLPNLVRGRICFRKGDDTCAHEAWSRAIALRPDSVPALTGLGILGEHEYFLRARQLAPDYRGGVDLEQRFGRRDQ